MTDVIEKIIVEDVGGEEFEDGEFLVEVQITQAIREKLRELGIEIPENPIDGILQKDGIFVPNMTSIRAAMRKTGQRTFYMESINDVPYDSVPKAILNENKEIRAKVIAVMGKKNAEVAEVTLVLKKEKSED